MDFFFKKISHLGDHPGIDAVVPAQEADVFEQQRLDGSVPGTLPEAQQGAVDGRAAVEPGRGGVDKPFVKIVVAVPFQQTAGHPGVFDHGPDQAGHAPGQGGSGIGHPVAHGITEADLDVDARGFPQFHELDGKGNAKTVDVGPSDVFKVAAGGNPQFQRPVDDFQVLVEGLGPVEVELVKNMVIGDRGQDAGFLEFHRLDQFQVLGVGPDPAGDLRVGDIPFPAATNRFLVPIAVQEEFGLADDPPGAGEAAEEIKNLKYLFHRIRGPGLLAVPKGGVGDPELIGRVDGYKLVVEVDPADFLVGENIPLEVGLGNIFQVILPEAGMFVVQDLFDWDSSGPKKTPF